MKKRQGGRMPGKAMQRGSGMDERMRKRMMKDDFARDEWQFVCKDAELGAETGSTKAVEAGQDYKGTKYIWTLVRGDPPPKEEGAERSEKTAFAVDGNCRCCLFPMINGRTEREADGNYAITCGACGNKYSLENGEVLEFLPANNPIQWANKLANEKKGPQKAGVLPTRVSKSGRVYVRLPDGTLTKNLNDQNLVTQ
jgi:nitrite reductase/ring-hydroxylating ferredoxin subunit